MVKLSKTGASQVWRVNKNPVVVHLMHKGMYVYTGVCMLVFIYASGPIHTHGHR